MLRTFAGERNQVMSKPFISREIQIGKLRLGGKQLVRIQSMTNTPTLDTEATVRQVIRLAEAGCEMVRITAANVREAENLKKIKSALLSRGVDIPLIADIHFQPMAAEVAAEIVDKVRINPGNYVGSYLKNRTYSDEAYREEIERTAQNLEPLLKICKKHQTAIRIGINHGSLSDRILYRYGNTAEGMVASATEFIEICRKAHFHDLVLSLKSSHVPTMIKANRLMVARMREAGFDYPLHLGVTEAGNGEEARVKAAAGIGSLLAAGIGDTIRVSLTEAPEKEIPVAQKLVQFYGRGGDGHASAEVSIYTVKEKDSGKFPLVITKLKTKNADAEAGSIKLDKTENNSNPENKIVRLSYPAIPFEDLLLRVPADFVHHCQSLKAGGIWLENGGRTPDEVLAELSLKILQALGLRYTKTEFVACPSCGRTHFDIEKVLEEVKAKMSDLKGLKIAVMGCIVNGPGEMADADFGLMGSGNGKVNLYQKQMLIQKNIPIEDAAEKLLQLIHERT
jgi:(E)-4-hydroxy-3-methylbut-2-enyl-diphosphate synthase